MLSILCVRLTIKVKVGIPESFKVGWHPPPKQKGGRVTLIVQNYCFAIKYIEINIKILKANGEEAQGKRFYGDRYLLLKFIKSVNSNFRAF